MPLGRKAEIYAICQEYDLVLLEDDAYYTLQFPLPSGSQRSQPSPPPHPPTHPGTQAVCLLLWALFSSCGCWKNLIGLGLGSLQA